MLNPTVTDNLELAADGRKMIEMVLHHSDTDSIDRRKLKELIPCAQERNPSTTSDCSQNAQEYNSISKDCNFYVQDHNSHRER